jgi:tetratricopeptide (TPR) repeat protein
MKFQALLRRSLLVLTIVSFWDISLAFGGEIPSSEAQKLFREKKYEKVTEILMPHLTELTRADILILGKSYSELHNTALALKIFSAGVSKTPQDAEMKSLLGLEQIRAGKTSEALATLKEVTEKNRTYLPAYQYMIQIFEKTDSKANKYELRLLYQDMVERIGERYEFIEKLCGLTTEEALYDLAVTYCQQAIRLQPREANNLVHLGLAFKETGKVKESEYQLKRAADSFSKSELAQLTYAKFHEENKNFIDAFKYYLRSVSANPKSVKGLVGLGRSGVEIQKLNESLQAFEKACRIDKSALSDFRKSTSSLMQIKDQTWYEKFQKSLDKCP